MPGCRIISRPGGGGGGGVVGGGGGGGVVEWETYTMCKISFFKKENCGPTARQTNMLTNKATFRS